MNRRWKASLLFAFSAFVALAACNTKTDDGRAGSSPPSTIAPTPGPQPTFATPTTLEHAPPPISGGTLTVARDGHTVVAADPDRDRVYVVDVPSRTVKFSIALAAGSEPGRVAVDTHGRAHVALRSSGKVATIDLASGALTERPVCVAPRGIAYDGERATLHVACAEGKLVSIPDSGPERTVALDRDLRDVVVSHGKIFVSRFRAANILVLSGDGSLERSASTHGGNLGWRVVAPPVTEGAEETDEPAVVSQEPVNPAGTAGAGYYGSGATDACLAPTITTTRLDIPGRRPILVPPAVLPVDLATNGKEYAIVAAGNAHTAALPQLFVHRVGKVDDESFAARGSDCLQMAKAFLPGQAIAAAFDGDDQLLVQSREPAALYIMSPDRQRIWKEIPLANESREDTGHAIFHSNSGGFLACASCHAEGGEDGRTWKFVEGDRRTPSMQGTVANTAPFHWDGTMKDLRQLVDHVFVTRMSGPSIDDARVETLKSWLFRLPAPPKLERPAEAVARGSALFRARGCATCHSGPAFTNNETSDVGTGGLFQVPSLVGVAWRAPFLHNGCASTLKDRFGACGGDKHGNVAGLDSAQLSDLTNYLESL